MFRFVANLEETLEAKKERLVATLTKDLVTIESDIEKEGVKLTDSAIAHLDALKAELVALETKTVAGITTPGTSV